MKFILSNDPLCKEIWHEYTSGLTPYGKGFFKEAWYEYTHGITPTGNWFLRDYSAGKERIIWEGIKAEAHRMKAPDFNVHDVHPVLLDNFIHWFWHIIPHTIDFIYCWFSFLY